MLGYNIDAAEFSTLLRMVTRIKSCDPLVFLVNFERPRSLEGVHESRELKGNFCFVVSCVNIVVPLSF